MRIAVALILVMAVAGCSVPGFGKNAPDAHKVEDRLADRFAHTTAFEQEHAEGLSHRDAAPHLGANTSYNLELVGYSNGFDASGDPNAIPAVQGYNELAVSGHYVFLVRSSGDGSRGGFVIIDVADPTNPRIVGEHDAIGGVDIEISEDGNTAFFAVQRNSIEQVVTAGSVDGLGAAPRGIQVIDVTDKTKPTMVGFTPLPYNGPHTLTYVRHPLDGGEYLVATTYDFLSNLVPSATLPPVGLPFSILPLTQRVVVFQVQRLPLPVIGPVPTNGLGSVLLVPVGQFQILDTTQDGKLRFPHDTFVQQDPFANRTLLYVSYWDLGLRVVDISNPINPNLGEVGAWTDFSPSALNNIHFARPFNDLIDGRQVTVTEPEIIDADGETGQITFLDTSDPANIEKLGSWTLPPGPQGQLSVHGLDFSPHNFDLWNGRVALGHYHAGVWVLDVHNEKLLRDPAAVAYYLPQKPREHGPALQPDVWGVKVSNQSGEDLLYVSDESSGLHILRYTGP